MSVKYHLSVNGPNRELVGVQAEGDGDHIYSEFMAAVVDLNLQDTLAALTSPAAAAPAVAAAAFQGAQIASQRAQIPSQPQVPAAAGGAPSCQHGQKQFKSGTSAKGPWEAWACPARSTDPTRCGFEFIR